MTLGTNLPALFCGLSFHCVHLYLPSNDLVQRVRPAATAYLSGRRFEKEIPKSQRTKRGLHSGSTIAALAAEPYPDKTRGAIDRAGEVE